MIKITEQSKFDNLENASAEDIEFAAVDLTEEMASTGLNLQNIIRTINYNPSGIDIRLLKSLELLNNQIQNDYETAELIYKRMEERR